MNSSIYKESYTAVDKSLNDILSKIMASNDIHAGDISPEQTFIWNSYVDGISKLFVELCEQNSTHD